MQTCDYNITRRNIVWSMKNVFLMYQQRRAHVQLILKRMREKKEKKITNQKQKRIKEEYMVYSKGKGKIKQVASKWQ